MSAAVGSSPTYPQPSPYMIWLPDGWQSYNGPVWSDDLFDPGTYQTYSGWEASYTDWPAGWYWPDYLSRPMEEYEADSWMYEGQPDYRYFDDFNSDIVRVFQENLGRAPTSDEANLWNLALNTDYLSVEDFSKHVAAWPESIEYKSAHPSIDEAKDKIDTIYWTYWGEEPDENAEIWVDRLFSGSWTEDQIKSYFANTPEGQQQADFNARHSLVYEDVETYTGLRQQVMLKDNYTGGMSLLGFVGEFDMRPYGNLQSSFASSDSGDDSPFPDTDPPVELPVGTFNVDPGFLAYDASGAVANDQRYTFVPSRADLQPKTDNSTISAMIGAISNGIANAASDMLALIGIDLPSMSAAQIDPAVLQKGVADTMQKVAPALAPGIPTVYVNARGTAQPGDYVFTYEVYYGVTKNGVPVFNNGKPTSVVYINATRVDVKTNVDLGNVCGLNIQPDTTMPPEASRFMSGLFNGIKDVTIEPGAQTYDLLLATASVLYNEVARKADPSLPAWYPKMISGIADAYDTGVSQGSLVLSQIPIANLVQLGPVVADAIKAGDTGVIAEVLGGIVASGLTDKVRASEAEAAAVGLSEHKAMRWDDYQQRGGTWDYERWSNVYDANMVRAKNANDAVESYRASIGWGETEQTVNVTIDGTVYARRLDIADKDSLRGVEYKTGYQSATQEVLWELERDAALNAEGWDIEWVFRGTASKPLLDALEKAEIKYRFEQ